MSKPSLYIIVFVLLIVLQIDLFKKKKELVSIKEPDFILGEISIIQSLAVQQLFVDNKELSLQVKNGSLVKIIFGNNLN